MKCFRAFTLFNGFKVLCRFTLRAKVLMRSSKTCLARYKTEKQGNLHGKRKRDLGLVRVYKWMIGIGRELRSLTAVSNQRA